MILLLHASRDPSHRRGFIIYLIIHCDLSTIRRLCTTYELYLRAPYIESNTYYKIIPLRPRMHTIWGCWNIIHPERFHPITIGNHLHGRYMYRLCVCAILTLAPLLIDSFYRSISRVLWHWAIQSKLFPVETGESFIDPTTLGREVLGLQLLKQPYLKNINIKQPSPWHQFPSCWFDTENTESHT